MLRDVTKDARFGWKEYYVGTVKIKCLNDESHASKNNNNPVMRGLKIKNLVTEDNTKMESFARDILKIEKDTFNHGVMVLALLFPQPSLMSQILSLLLTSHGMAMAILFHRSSLTNR